MRLVWTDPTTACRRFLRRATLPIAAVVPLLCLDPSAVRAADPVADGASQWHQDGQASYYSGHWRGHRTSSGDVFDPRKLTAAHASLPLGTRLRVTSESSGESVVVIVNDRQPAHGHRIIDLSPAAASRLHMIGSGVAEVEISEASGAEATEAATHDASFDQEVAEAPDDGSLGAVDAPARRPARARHHRHHH